MGLCCYTATLQKKEKEMDSELPSLKEVMEAFEDFMKKTNEDMVKRYGLESDDE